MPLTGHSLFHTVEGLAALGTIVLALGTLTLAFVTLLTARRTRTLAEATARLAGLTEEEVKAVIEQASAARQEVEVSRSALQASIQPTLIDADGPVRFKTDIGRTTTVVEVAARNVGPGLAVMQQVTMHWDEPQAAVTPTTYFGDASRRVVPSTELIVATFTFTGRTEAERVRLIGEVGRFWVKFDYVDRSGTQGEVARLDVEHDVRDDVWKVKRVHLLPEGSEEPYVSSG